MIWITGCAGMLGKELSLLLEAEGIEHVGSDREVDIADADAVAAFGGKRRIDWIANCAAYTAVDSAEEDIAACRRLNAEGPAVLADFALRAGARLLHISTDYVFDGKGSRPYLETDEIAPQSAYGLTKREGELEVLKRGARNCVFRTAWLYGTRGKNFADTILRLAGERGEIRVVDDQRGSPSWAGDLARAIVCAMRAEEKGRGIPGGVYHFTNEGMTTWFGFAREICEEGRKRGLVTRECAITPCASDEYPVKAPRPAYSVLDKSKIKAALGVRIPDWREGLARFLDARAASAPDGSA
jgi:dTDP-4-dehydrorhamnose reductase